MSKAKFKCFSIMFHALSTATRRLCLPAHVGHGSFVYITMNPAVLSHSCAFPWLRM